MISSDKYPKYIQYLKTRPEFEGFSDEEMNILMNNMRVKNFKKGQILFDQGDDRNRFYFVISGLVRAERIDENADFIFYTYIKKDLAFPYRGMFSSKYYAYTARVMTDVEILYFPISTFESLLKKNNHMMIKTLQEMALIISETEDQLQRMVIPSAKQRVIQALKTFNLNLGEVDKNGRSSIPYPITIKEVGTMSGTTRETAGQIVKELANQNLLSYHHKKFIFEESFFNSEILI